MGEWLDLDLVLFHPSLLTGLFTGMLKLTGDSVLWVSSGDGSGFAVFDSQVLLDIPVSDRLEDSE